MEESRSAAEQYLRKKVILERDFLGGCSAEVPGRKGFYIRQCSKVRTVIFNSSEDQPEPDREVVKQIRKRYGPFLGDGKLFLFAIGNCFIQGNT